jgi:uncharacterized Zn finger protein (UPF0148 family)
MNPEKYKRDIKILCPTCGSTDFSYEQGSDETIEQITCASCGREFTKDELLHENSENFNAHLSDIKKELKNDIAKEFHDSLKKALKGNKNFRIE